ncbi:MAG TPA: ABC transporter substrate-binding protein [Thermoanaerobaculia bacterium]|nr:ABC transporter substrate-binding protein [Thermoanaerobaculia bacterium]
MPSLLKPDRRGRIRRAALLLAALAGAAACDGQRGAMLAPEERLSFLVLASERPVWLSIAESFRASRGVSVDLVEGPNATDLRESQYTAALLAGDDSFDLVYMDVTWTSKFASAGWLVPLDDLFPDGDLGNLLPSAVAAGRHRGRLYRVPVRTDVGLLYYRRDLLEAAGLAPPRSFTELLAAARALQSPPELWGFLWQGSQYEGLVCVFLEVLHGFGGFWVDEKTREVGLDRPPALAALEFLRRCRSVERISPPGVTSLKEDESRRLFQDGRAVFLRNWPYVFRLAQAPDSPVRGKIGVELMVHAPGSSGGAALGGWGFGISRFSRRPRLAAEFVRHAVSLGSQRLLCRDTGYAPALAAAYRDPELLAANPLLAEIRRIHENAVARPAIPQYALASDILQRHLSACLAGLAPPDRALAEASRETRLLLETKR